MYFAVAIGRACNSLLLYLLRRVRHHVDPASIHCLANKQPILESVGFDILPTVCQYLQDENAGVRACMADLLQVGGVKHVLEI